MRLLLSTLFLEIGLVLIVTPWTTYWERNYFLQDAELLGALLNSGFVRGAVSGLGIVNMAMAIVDITRQVLGRGQARAVRGLFESRKEP